MATKVPSNSRAGEAGAAKQDSPRLPFYRVLWVQVALAMVAAVVLACLDRQRAVAMKPLGDAFIRLITMIITLRCGHPFVLLPIRACPARSGAHCLVDANTYPASIFLAEASTSDRVFVSEVGTRTACL